MPYYYSYSEYLSDCHKLTDLIDEQFDAIITLSRGGMTLGHTMGEFYDIREVYTINTIGYNDKQKLDEVKIFNIPDIKNAKNILILDDIIDSGDTMREVMEIMRSHYQDVTFKIAVLFYKPTASIDPDWYVQEAKAWIDFFWTEDLKKVKNGI
ncbi:MAG: phosphoribosyltransferase family protein [Campylobacterota bacterium]|nr:phosphoribosyltransferase family protein [Campylobacterota bacterium]